MATKLQEKREELGAKQKLLARVFEEAGESYDFAQVKCLGEDLSTQDVADKVREMNAELKDLADECRKEEFREIGERTQRVGEEMNRPAAKPMAHPAGGGSGGVKSLGHQFVESPEYRDYCDGEKKGIGVSFPDVELKTLMATTAGWAPGTDDTGMVVPAVTRPIQVLDLIPMADTDSASVTYWEETLRTHSASEKLEGATYAESAFELTERSTNVRKITDSLPVTDEQLEDRAQVRSYIDQRLRFGLRQRLDNQVLNGNGTPPNLEGILNVAGIQTQALGTDPVFDAIHKAMTLVRVTGRAFPGAVVLHPNDWQEIRLTRTADGIYILGNPAVAGPMTLFGLPVALGDVISEGTGLVGDFANFCALYDRRGIDIQVGFTGTQFVEGKQTMRADIRAAFAVYRPAAFCTVTGI